MTRTDSLILLLATGLVISLYALLWREATPGRDLSVWVGGEERLRLPLDQPRRLEVAGALGASVIEIAGGRARVVESPGPRQICVRTGWLKSAGESAVCLPNQVVIQIEGGKPRFDSMNF